MNSQNNNCFIYGIFDPITNELRYIGKTIQGTKRFKYHLCKTEINKNNYRANWLRGLINKGLTPKFEILEYAEESQLEELEMFYISYFKFVGCRLTNLTTGGEGCNRRKLSNYTKHKIGQKVKNSYDENKRKLYSKRFKERRKTFIFDDDYKLKCSNGHKKYPVVDLNSGEVYKSLMSVCRKYNFSSGQLSDHLNRKTLSIRSQFFSWYDESIINIDEWRISELNSIKSLKYYKDRKIYQYKKIFCSTLNRQFESIKIAAKELNIPYNSLIQSLKNNRDYKGLLFNYVKA